MSTLEMIRRVFGETPVRNIKLLPHPLTAANFPLEPAGSIAFERDEDSTRPLPTHHCALLGSDATLNAPDYGLIITTASAYRFQLLAKSLMQQFNHIRPIPNNVSWMMQTALHEVLTNAVTHGNMNGGNLIRHNRDNLTSLGQMLNTRLKNLEYAQRYLTITLKLTPKEAIWHIADEGTGFDVPVTIERINDDPLRYSGRGIIMTQKLASYLKFESGGRVAVMAFAL